MNGVDTQLFCELQKSPKNIRHICILAHVDHGKTTLADSVLASNGIISQKMVGKMRYLDSRKDEQERGITMKSSAVAIHYNHNGEKHLINLIDSPGHVDFSGEVSTAVRLCDGAIILVDVVEGVCQQTRIALKQAWIEHLRPMLVLNKIDRLILERKLSPLDAYAHLVQVLEQVNAVVGELFATDIIKKSDNVFQQRTEAQAVSETFDWSSGLDDCDDSSVYFSPEQGNVIFASALDGWGFRTHHFADICAEKLNLKAEILTKIFWSSDFYFNSKTKRVMKGAQVKAKKPLFVQFVLDSIWAIYDSIMINKNKSKAEGIIKTLNLKVSAREAKQAERTYLQTVIGQWLPLSNAVLGMVCSLVPSPKELSEEKIEGLMCSSTYKFEHLPLETRQLKNDFQACSASTGAPVIVCVSKMFPIDRKLLLRNKQRAKSLNVLSKMITEEEIAIRREKAHQMQASRLEATNSSAGLTIPVSEPSKIEPCTMAQPQSCTATQPQSCTAAQRQSCTTTRPQSCTAAQRQSCTTTRPQSCTAAQPQSCTTTRPQSCTTTRPQSCTAAQPQSCTAEQSQSCTSAYNDSNAAFIAFARVYSGTVRKGQTVFVLGPKHDPAQALKSNEEVRETLTLKDLQADQHITKATIGDVYILMGEDVVEIEEVPAGNVLGIGGLEDHVLKSATLSSTVACPRFIDLHTDNTPILRVAIEPVHPRDMALLLQGLRLLNQADPCVQVLAQESGEHVLVTAGEVHLQRCVNDLKEKYASVEINVSPPIVPFRETIIVPPKVDMVNEAISEKLQTKKMTNTDVDTSDGRIYIKTANKLASICMRAVPLPPGVAKLLEQNCDILKEQHQSVYSLLNGVSDSKLTKETTQALKDLQLQLNDLFQKAGNEWANAVEQIWAFGPRKCGPNILLNRIPGYDRPSVWIDSLSEKTPNSPLFSYDNSFITGFQMATQAGPICDEPMMGVCFIIENWTIEKEITQEMDQNTKPQAKARYSPQIAIKNENSHLQKLSSDDNPRLQEMSSDDNPRLQEMSSDDNLGLQETSSNDNSRLLKMLLNDNSKFQEMLLDNKSKLQEMLLDDNSGLQETSFDDNPGLQETPLGDNPGFQITSLDDNSGLLEIILGNNSRLQKILLDDNPGLQERPSDDNSRLQERPSNDNAGLQERLLDNNPGLQERPSDDNPGLLKKPSDNNPMLQEMLLDDNSKLQEMLLDDNSKLKEMLLDDNPRLQEMLLNDNSVLQETPSDNVSLRSSEPSSASSMPYGPFTGQIMSSVKEACRKAFQAQPQRLMTPMYSCNIQVTGDVLGKMYAVLLRRHGRVLHADIQEGSQTFFVTAELPVIESFNFSNEIRKQTSGAAHPQLVFSHWEVVSEDPFWVPSTDEEYAHFGEKADAQNRALEYVNSARKRKGLAVDEKIVEHAEKQRNLTKNK